MEINIHEAKTHFSKLLKKVEAGEEVTISRAGVPVAKLVAVQQKSGKRPIGIGKGSFRITDDFDAPMSEEELDLWYTPLDAGKKRR